MYDDDEYDSEFDDIEDVEEDEYHINKLHKPDTSKISDKIDETPNFQLSEEELLRKEYAKLQEQKQKQKVRLEDLQDENYNPVTLFSLLYMKRNNIAEWKDVLKNDTDIYKHMVEFQGRSLETKVRDFTFTEKILLIRLLVFQNESYNHLSPYGIVLIFCILYVLEYPEIHSSSKDRFGHFITANDLTKAAASYFVEVCKDQYRKMIKCYRLPTSQINYLLSVSTRFSFILRKIKSIKGSSYALRVPRKPEIINYVKMLAGADMAFFIMGRRGKRVMRVCATIKGHETLLEAYDIIKKITEGKYDTRKRVQATPFDVTRNCTFCEFWYGYGGRQYYEGISRYVRKIDHK